MDYKDYYKILGVSKSDSQDTIRKAYRKLARKHHPDFNKNNPASESRFKDVNEAYQVLRDPEKRKKYDQLGMNWDKYKNFDHQGAPFDFGNFQQRQSPPGGGFDFGRGKSTGFSDFFRTFFNGFDPFGESQDFGAGRRPSQKRAPDMTAALEVTVREAVMGARKPLTFNREEMCQACRGQGMKGSEICPTCFGRGLTSRPERIDITVPPGVQTGSRLRLRGKGGEDAQGQSRGDLYLQISIRSDSVFSIRGRNVHCQIPVTVPEAVLGAEIEVPTITGKVKMRIPPESENDKTFRLKGKGLPQFGKHSGGDQIVKIRIVLPHGLTPREKELYHELASLRLENPRSKMT